MDFSFDIFRIYRQYCDIMMKAIDKQWEGCNPDDEIQKVRNSREALTKLWEVVEPGISPSFSVIDEVSKLMFRLDLAEFSEFSRFYDFVYFICRENGQKSITVSRAVMAWKTILSGRFRLLNQWCNFVEKYQRYNISEDTWRQVLAFSRCVHENLEGYDPKGAWPVLIDEFVEYMYSIRRSHPNSGCNCADSDPQLGENTQSGLTNIPGSKRRPSPSSSGYSDAKRRHIYLFENSVKQSNPSDSAKSPCSVEGCLSKGFAGLLSGPSCLKFDQDRRVSYT